jgi:hypothetical protein
MEGEPYPSKEADMRGRKPIRPVLTEADAKHLNEIASSPFWQSVIVSRAKTLLLLAEGERVKDIALKLGCAVATVAQRRRRFARTGVLGVVSNPPKPGRPPGKRQNMQPPVDISGISCINSAWPYPVLEGLPWPLMQSLVV